MAQETEMQAPKWKNELSINTIIQIVGFLGLFVAGGIAWGATTAAVGGNTRDILIHSSQIGSLQQEAARIENLSYRVTVQEQTVAQQSAAMEQLRSQMSSLQSDIRVIREILSRLEQKIDEQR